MAEPDIVIGIDSSTQSTKAIAWSRDGEPLCEVRADIPMNQPSPGLVEQDVEDWWKAACSTVRSVTDQIDPARVAGVAISNQRETVAFLDQEGRQSRSAIVWLDERALDEIPLLVNELGAEHLHSITGKPVDITPIIYRLSWLKRHHPKHLEQTSKIVDVHAFLSGRLTGRIVSSWTSADPFGIFDIEKKQWFMPFLDHLNLSIDQFPELQRPGTLIGTVQHDAAIATGLSLGTPLYAGGGDGQCAGLGVNAVRPGVLYLNMGTAIIAGVWSASPAISMNWRTMTSPSGEGYFLESIQRAGAYYINWFIDTFSEGRKDAAIFDKLETQAAQIEIGSEGVLVCPYLTGCMNPHWDANARANFIGLGPMHHLGHLYRASLEALTLEIARSITAMNKSGLQIQRIIAVGGGANSPLWTKMIADATGLQITKSKSLEASALGAGISAAVGAGWFNNFNDAAISMSSEGDTIKPDASVASIWSDLSERQTAAYIPSE
jgi:xylulokinase